MESNTPSVGSFVQSLSETLSKIRPSSQTDANRIEIAKNHLGQIKRHINKLEERVEVLEEQVKVLEENKNKELMKEE